MSTFFSLWESTNQEVSKKYLSNRDQMNTNVIIITKKKPQKVIYLKCHIPLISLACFSSLSKIFRSSEPVSSHENVGLLSNLWYKFCLQTWLCFTMYKVWLWSEVNKHYNFSNFQLIFWFEWHLLLKITKIKSFFFIVIISQTQPFLLKWTILIVNKLFLILLYFTLIDLFLNM